MMKKILNLFKQAWFLSLLGIILLSVIIYYIAPLIFSEEKSTLATLSAITVLVIFWLIFLVVSLLRVRKKNEAILEGLKDNVVERDEHQEAVDDELDILRDRLSSAVSELKSRRMKHGKGESRYLYQLPWYIIIGPPSSGKTTLLKNSSLKTALSDDYGHDAVKGVGGTRHCDWWFTEDAVLLDTAGRYTTQDSNETDHKAWLGFLGMLQKSRERRPLNGIIIAISMEELLTSESIHQHAAEIRKRLQEIYDQFNLKLPVYLTFTKMDLLAGFSEYFDGMEKQTRDQVWGTTFTKKNRAIRKPLEILQEELNLLEETLKDKTLLKLEKEVDLERRKKLYAFPEQFATVKNSVNQFVNEVFSVSRYQNNIVFRGVYFTSAEQTGNPIDKLLANLAHTFGFQQKNIVPTPRRGKSYFINKLLHDVIFEEAELAGLNPAYEKKQKLLRWGVFGGAALTVLTGSGLWLTSYAKNDTTIDQLNLNTAVFKDSTLKNRDASNIMGVLDILNKAAHLFDPDNTMMATLGLSQQEKLKQQAKISYRNALEAKLLPHVIYALEMQLQTLNAKLKFKSSDEMNQSHDNLTLFQTLKSYLILRSHQNKRYKDNRDLLNTLVQQYWSDEHGSILSPKKLAQLTEHLTALLAEKPSLSANKLTLKNSLVVNARSILTKMKMSEIIYAKLKAEIKLSKNLIAFALEGNAEGRINNADRYFTRISGEPLNEGIIGLYTYKGSLQVRTKSLPLIKVFLKDNWVLDANIDEQLTLAGKEGAENTAVSSRVDDTLLYKRTTAEVLRLYMREYIKVWDDYLMDINLIIPTTLDDTTDLLEALMQDSSPILKFAKAVADETYLSKPVKGAEAVAEEAQKELVKKLGKAGQLANKALGDKALSELTKLKNDEVSPHFKSIRKFAKSGYKVLKTKIFKTLNTQLKSLEPDEEDADKQKKIQGIEKSLEKLKNAVNRRPVKPITAWMLKFRKTIIGILDGKVSESTNRAWNSGVYANYRAKIRGKYPAGGHPSNAIPMGDFANFFGPDGLLDRYFKENLKDSINQDRKTWTAKEGNISQISEGALRQLQRADHIKKAFFPAGSSMPKITLSVTPNVVDPTIVQMTFTMGGKEINYQEGGRLDPVQMEWPGSNPYIGLNVTYVDGTTATLLKAESYWSLIEFVKKGRQRALGGNTYRVGFSGVSFKLRADTSDNIISAIKELKRFQCPKNLVN
jgi:type VI secretion system protein ImpL